MQDAVSAQVAHDARPVIPETRASDVEVSAARAPDVRIPVVRDDALPAGHNPHAAQLAAAAEERQRREATRGLQRN